MDEKLKKEQENILKKLSRIELEYFRNWLMNHYDIFALEHNITSYIDIIDEVDAEHKDIINFLKKIHDHSKWEIDEKEFIDEENSGYYVILDVQESMENLSPIEYERFTRILLEMYPAYKDMNDLDFFKINNSFGEENYPTWDEALKILKKVESWEMNMDELLSDYYEICKKTVQKYERKFKIKLPVEVQKIVSFKKGYLLYKDKEYHLNSPKEWIDWFEFHGFNLNRSGLIPLLFYDSILVVCFDPNKKEYIYKEIGFGTESDGYKSLTKLLDNYDLIFQIEEEE